MCHSINEKYFWATRKRTFSTLCIRMLNFYDCLFLFSFCNLNFSHWSFILSKNCYASYFLWVLCSHKPLFLTIVSRLATKRGNKWIRLLKKSLFRILERRMKEDEKFLKFLPIPCPALKQQSAEKKINARSGREWEEEKLFIKRSSK